MEKMTPSDLTKQCYLAYVNRDVWIKASRRSLRVLLKVLYECQTSLHGKNEENAIW